MVVPPVGIPAQDDRPAAEGIQQRRPHPPASAVACVQDDGELPRADARGIDDPEHPPQVSGIGVFARRGRAQRVPGRPGEFAAIEPIEDGAARPRGRGPSPPAGRTSGRCTRAGCARPRSGSPPPPQVAHQDADGGRGRRPREQGVPPGRRDAGEDRVEEHRRRGPAVVADDDRPGLRTPPHTPPRTRPPPPGRARRRPPRAAPRCSRSASRPRPPPRPFPASTPDRPNCRGGWALGQVPGRRPPGNFHKGRVPRPSPRIFSRDMKRCRGLSVSSSKP